MEEMIKEILVAVKNIDKRLETVEKRLNVIAERLETVEKRLNVIAERLETVEKRLNVIEERLDTIEKRLDALEERMNCIEVRMDNMEARMDKFDERQNKFEERLDQMHDETVMEIRELAESISKIMNKKYDELLSKIDEIIKNKEIDHKVYEAKLKKLDAGQKYLESKVEEAIIQKVG